MIEQEPKKLAAYREVVNRSQMASFYRFYHYRYPALAYVADLASTVVQHDAQAIGMTKQECEQAWRIGVVRGERGAASVADDETALLELDSQERNLTDLLEECLNLKSQSEAYS